MPVLRAQAFLAASQAALQKASVCLKVFTTHAVKRQVELWPAQSLETDDCQLGERQAREQMS